MLALFTEPRLTVFTQRDTCDFVISSGTETLLADSLPEGLSGQTLLLIRLHVFCTSDNKTQIVSFFVYFLQLYI